MLNWKKLITLYLRCWLALISLIGFSQVSAEDFLSPEQAFKVSASMINANTVAVSFRIADGYYLYRHSLQFTAKNADLGTPFVPAGNHHFDDNFQKDVETYQHTLQITLPVVAQGQFALTVHYQGCAEKGVCYPPMTSVIPLSPTERGNANLTEASSLQDTLQNGSTWWMVGLFLLLGIGLSVTPCVLPMVPILSTIIVGDQQSHKKNRSFLLSLCYVLGMALVYTLVGIVAGLLGEGLAGWLQQPWVLIIFALLMVILALSLLNVYQLQTPAPLQAKLTQWTNTLGGGKYISTVLMGAVSALIVGPCVAAPLAGVLLYISQTQDAFRGGIALFALAIGMGVPLLAIGAFSKALLPKLGLWMEHIKQLFAVLMIATAIWMVQPLLPGWLLILSWAVLALIYAAYVLWTKGIHWFFKVIGLLALIWGSIQFANVVTGGRDILHPFVQFMGATNATIHPAKVKFVRIHNEAELDAALKNNPKSYAMLDFYADWCVSCIEMEKFTFPDTQVQEKLDQILLLQIDVTQNDADDRAMLKRFNLFGPPGIIFFNHTGQEIADSRVIGFQNKETFLQSLNKFMSQ